MRVGDRVIVQAMTGMPAVVVDKVYAFARAGELVTEMNLGDVLDPIRRKQPVVDVLACVTAEAGDLVQDGRDNAFKNIA